MRSLKLSALLAAIGLLTGCSVTGITDRINPYRIDVRQGNYVDQEMIGRVKKGMTRDQVRFALGTPLMIDAFHPDRWEYVYRFQPGRGETEQRVISVFFIDDRVDHIEGDVQAGEGQSATAQAPRSRVIEIEAPVKK